MTSDEIYQKIEHIPGWFSKEDIEGLMSMVMPLHPVVIECGTYCGRSANAMAALWPGALIHTCDPADEPQRQLPDGCVFYNLPGREVTLLGNLEADLLFLDDSHTYDDIKENFQKFEPHVKPGGYVAFHDYWMETDAVDGVRRFVNELGNCDLSSKGQYGLAIWKKPKS